MFEAQSARRAGPGSHDVTTTIFQTRSRSLPYHARRRAGSEYEVERNFAREKERRTGLERGQIVAKRRDSAVGDG